MTLRHHLLPFLFLCLLTWSCDASVEEEGELYGADFAAGDAISAQRLLSSYTPEALEDSVSVTLVGTVEEVCQAKGCWMTLATGQGERMTVKFKDYKFFVPKDLSGQHVIMHGLAYYAVVPAEELRHLAEDGGKSPEEVAAITVPSRELHFLADGVRLR